VQCASNGCGVTPVSNVPVSAAHLPGVTESRVATYQLSGHNRAPLGCNIRQMFGGRLRRAHKAFCGQPRGGYPSEGCSASVEERAERHPARAGERTMSCGPLGQSRDWRHDGSIRPAVDSCRGLDGLGHRHGLLTIGGVPAAQLLARAGIDVGFCWSAGDGAISAARSRTQQLP
jgi:hypothetical protein